MAREGDQSFTVHMNVRSISVSVCVLKALCLMKHKATFLRLDMCSSRILHSI